MARVRNGHVDMHNPEEAKVLSGHRVHVVAEVTQETHESSHPAYQLGLSCSPRDLSLRWHVPFLSAVPGGKKKPSEQVLTQRPA